MIGASSRRCHDGNAIDTFRWQALSRDFLVEQPLSDTQFETVEEIVSQGIGRYRHGQLTNLTGYNTGQECDDGGTEMDICLIRLR